MLEVAVRRATPDDAREVAAVHVGTWQSAYRGLVPDGFLDGLDVERRVAAYAELGTLTNDAEPVWVAERDGEVIGFVMVGPSRDEVGVGEVGAIYVTESHWDTGAGHELMRQAVSWLSGRYAQATLWVLEGNERARSFYEGDGWFFDGTTMEDDRGTFVLREVRYRIEF